VVLIVGIDVASRQLGFVKVRSRLTRPDLGRWSRSRRNQIILLLEQCTSRGRGDLPIMLVCCLSVKWNVVYE
jgi:hypothetical protein